ncbi:MULTISPECIES: LIC12192 family sporadic carbohydrate cluster protein [unclassified Microcoleus]|uniref:LIC12192 family sporadic carbohydrate cluster protein n=1 Tax=unclassified Microcoleus TaxID=2642155 RepID=UPI002FD4FB0B
MKSTKGWRGYISSREIGESTIPQRLQNMVIRNYAQSKGMVFLLSGTEYYMDNCYMMLSALLEELEKISGIIFYSVKLLPPDLTERKKIYSAVLSKGCGLHFALEELAIVQENDTELIEDIIACKLLTGKVKNSFLWEEMLKNSS